jgi:polyhydroxyalkanoate synthesis repressor PhaR
MPRIVKRYGSRKLYDTSSSRYIGLDELAAAIRAGEHVQVVDNTSGDDATAAVLTQIISEEGRRGAGPLSTHFLHDLIRIGERISERAARAGEAAATAGAEAVEAGLERARKSAGELAHSAVETVQRLRPATITELREEVERLRSRLDALETPKQSPSKTTRKKP